MILVGCEDWEGHAQGMNGKLIITFVHYARRATSCNQDLSVDWDLIIADYFLHNINTRCLRTRMGNKAPRHLQLRRGM
jgi:hypothetical protein